MLALVAVVLLAAGPDTPGQVLYDGKLQNGWMDYGWSPRTLNQGPASVDLSEYGGWILGKPGSKGPHGGLMFRCRSTPSCIDTVEVRLEGMPGQFPRIRLTAEHRVAQRDGFEEFHLAWSQLNPEQKVIEQVVFQGTRAGAQAPVAFDKVAFTTQIPSPREAASPAVPKSYRSRPAKLSVDCRAPTHPISPLIYGVAYDFQNPNDEDVFALGITARRWGGNHTTRYNWQLKNACSAASDWFFRNMPCGPTAWSYDTILEHDLARGVKTALTVPLLGWVAKDTTSASFPGTLYPSQEAFETHEKRAGNGKAPGGKLLEPPAPTETSVLAPPSFVEQWVATIVKKDAAGRGRSVHQYILDNEPMLWHETHRDVHPEPPTYDEVLDKTLRYAAAVRRADPGAVIAGPAEWGWTAYQYSAADMKAGTFLRPDRRKHGDVPWLLYYLTKLAEHEKKTGQSLLDVLDVHFYPQAPGLGSLTAPKVDAEANALRLRSTRALWDPTYKDESWIADKVELLPRLRRWIAQGYPGRGISIGEYNFGAGEHLVGGLAQAEVLGRFGQQEGVTSAFYFMVPKKGSPVAWAFRAFRNYDGAGASFPGVSVPARGEGLVSLFAARDEQSKKLVLVALNLDPQTGAAATVDTTSCGAQGAARAFRYAGGAQGFSPVEVSLPTVDLPPYTITVLELSLPSPAKP